MFFNDGTSFARSAVQDHVRNFKLSTYLIKKPRSVIFREENTQEVWGLPWKFQKRMKRNEDHQRSPNKVRETPHLFQAGSPETGHPYCHLHFNLDEERSAAK